jgi:hypothetical protein
MTTITHLEFKEQNGSCVATPWDVYKQEKLPEQWAYTDITTAPEWMQGRVAVLKMLDAGSDFVDGVGQRINGYAYWLVPDADYVDAAHEELLRIITKHEHRRTRDFIIVKNYDRSLEDASRHAQLELREAKQIMSHDAAAQLAGLRAELINNVKAQGVMIKSAQTPPLTPFPYGEAAEEKQSWIDKVFRR